MGEPVPTSPAGGPTGPSGAGALLEALRVSHWIKNAFVVAPILFAGRIADPRAWGECLGALVGFCLLSSSTYLFNDVCDRQSDQAHPSKRLRPVASGRLSPAAALVASAVLLAAGMGILVGVAVSGYDPDQPLMGMGLMLWSGSYVALNVLYSLWLKQFVVVDVILLSFGFVLRAMAGAAAIVVPISPWLVVCTFTLCLFIALTKRRSEINDLSADAAGGARPANVRYDRQDIEHMLTVSAALAILTYSLYCLAPGTVRRMHSAHLVWTIPLVIYGIFRYGRITRRAGRDDPVKVLVRDRIMWIVVGAYAAATALIIRFGGHPMVRDVLDAELLMGK